MKTTIYGLISIVLCASVAHSRQLKEFDNDINYDEAKVPHYDLPALMIAPDGTKITTPDEWRSIRRPQILSLFSNLLYGRIPEPEFAIQKKYTVLSTDQHFLDGKGTKKTVLILFSNKHGKAAITLQVITPNNTQKPVPAIMKLGSGPISELLDRGYAGIAISHNGFVGHNEVGFDRSIHRLFFHQGQSFPKASEWGVLSAIAWGHSRVLDYLETDDAIDASRVAVMGHSKNGKAALWTAAQDERYALVISAQSGCAGAALWRRRSGETLQKMVTRFPYWLCRNAWKFVNQEDDLPVDQHMLLALIAPRPVYVASGIDDTWADPRGEFASAYHASKVYNLLGKKGLQSDQLPPLGTAILDSDVGYHIREGGHSVEQYDWQMFLDFCDLHLNKH
jgi:hypothetical protein